MDSLPSLNRTNLIIARENIGFSTSAVSKKITSSGKDLVAKWEKSNELPTWSQIIKLAKIYSISEILFFSHQNIEKNRNIPDYRTSIDKKGGNDIQKLVNLVITRQKWLEKNLREAGWSKNKLQGTGKQIKNPADLAELISKKLGISINEIKKISGRKNTLDYLIQKAEDAGIFVGKTISYHKLKVDDFRGLFISNDYCPFIVLNRKDSISAQIFSFIHELSHFFRKTDAVSNVEFRSTNKGIDSEETFCNKVAAELLLPRSDFDKGFYNKSDIDSISDIYKVSRLFVFYRLVELGKIRRETQADIEEKIKRETEEKLKMKAEKDAKNNGGNYINSMKDSNGDLFNRVISSSYLDNKIGYVEAANLLRFSPEMV